MQKTDGNGCNSEVAELFGGSPDSGLVESELHAAIEPHAFCHLYAQAAWNERRRILDAQIEQVVAALEPHIENVAEPRCCQHAGDRAAALDHSIGNKRRPVHEF